MNIIKLTLENIKQLPVGKYAIFKNNILDTMFGIDKEEDTCYPISSTLGSDEIYSEEEYIKRFNTEEHNYEIVSADEIYNVF